MNTTKTQLLWMISLVILNLTNCKKVAFYDDSCAENCYILSGFVLDDSTNIAQDKVSVTLKVRNGIFVKQVVTTNTDSSGYWKMSFDANYIEDLEEGTLLYVKNSYLEREQDISFNPDDIDIERSFSNTIQKAGNIYFDINLTIEEITAIEIRYAIENENLTTSINTSQDKPLQKSLYLPIPAYSDIPISFWYETKSGLFNQSNWTSLGNPVVFNVNFQEVDTVSINL